MTGGVGTTVEKDDTIDTGHMVEAVAWNRFRVRIDVRGQCNKRVTMTWMQEANG